MNSAKKINTQSRFLLILRVFCIIHFTQFSICNFFLSTGLTCGVKKIIILNLSENMILNTLAFKLIQVAVNIVLLCKQIHGINGTKVLIFN